jgi:hypothetical protein
MAPQETNWWFALNEGLGEHRIRSIFARDYDTLFAGTNGRGAWEYTIANRPRPEISLPLVLRNHGSAVSLLNGDFEQGPSVGWGQYSWNPRSLILHESSMPVDAHGGQYATWLGGVYDDLAVIYQDATVPSGDPTLRFYLWIASADVCGYDYGIVYINTDPYAVWDLCDDEDTNGWVWGAVDLAPYAGLTVEIGIGAQTDSSLNSNLFIDDVTLGSARLADGGTRQALSISELSAAKGVYSASGLVGELVLEPLFLPLPEAMEPHGLLISPD